MSNTGKTDTEEVVGLIPMAGRAMRLAELPCSKEIYPVGPGAASPGTDNLPDVVCEHLLYKMRAANIDKAFIVLREGKWDIPAYLGHGEKVGMHLAYLMMGLPHGTPYSADQAYPFVKQAIVAFGFPDMMFGPENIFSSLLESRRVIGADVMLGLFPADRPEKADMVEVDGDGKVKQIKIKPCKTDLHYTWGVAVWAPGFTRFMHQFLRSRHESADRDPEIYIGDVVRGALEEGFSVYAMCVSEQPFVDIGTWDDLNKVTGAPSS